MGNALTVAPLVSNALEVLHSCAGACNQEGHQRRICSCRIHNELGRLALMLGEKFWVALVGGQYSGTAPSERALLRIFFPSPARPHVVYLEFRILAGRIEKGISIGRVPIVTVELGSRLFDFGAGYRSECDSS